MSGSTQGPSISLAQDLLSRLPGEDKKSVALQDRVKRLFNPENERNYSRLVDTKKKDAALGNLKALELWSVEDTRRNDAILELEEAQKPYREALQELRSARDAVIKGPTAANIKAYEALLLDDKEGKKGERERAQNKATAALQEIEQIAIEDYAEAKFRVTDERGDPANRSKVLKRNMGQLELLVEMGCGDEITARLTEFKDLLDRQQKQPAVDQASQSQQALQPGPIDGQTLTVEQILQIARSRHTQVTPNLNAAASTQSLQSSQSPQGPKMPTREGLMDALKQNVGERFYYDHQLDASKLNEIQKGSKVSLLSSIASESIDAQRRGDTEEQRKCAERFSWLVSKGATMTPEEQRVVIDNKPIRPGDNDTTKEMSRLFEWHWHNKGVQHSEKPGNQLEDIIKAQGNSVAASHSAADEIARMPGTAAIPPETKIWSYDPETRRYDLNLGEIEEQKRSEQIFIPRIDKDGQPIKGPSGAPINDVFTFKEGKLIQSTIFEVVSENSLGAEITTASIKLWDAQDKEKRRQEEKGPPEVPVAAPVKKSDTRAVSATQSSEDMARRMQSAMSKSSPCMPRPPARPNQNQAKQAPPRPHQ